MQTEKVLCLAHMAQMAHMARMACPHFCIEVPSCADSTILNSDNSQGLAGRMALPSRWEA